MMYIYFGLDFKSDVPGSVEFVKSSALPGVGSGADSTKESNAKRHGTTTPFRLSQRPGPHNQAQPPPVEHGVFRSVVDFQAAINRSVAETKADPTPLTWTANPDTIIAARTEGTSVRFYPWSRAARTISCNRSP